MEKITIQRSTSKTKLVLTNENGIVYLENYYDHFIDALIFNNGLMLGISIYEKLSLDTQFVPMEDSFLLILTYSNVYKSFILESFYYGPNKWCKMMCKLFKREEEMPIYSHYLHAIDLIEHNIQTRSINLVLNITNETFKLDDDYGMIKNNCI
jgi:hypothetical protein